MKPVAHDPGKEKRLLFKKQQVYRQRQHFRAVVHGRIGYLCPVVLFLATFIQLQTQPLP